MPKRRSMRRIVLVVLAASVVVALPGGGASALAPRAVARTSDFNGDGRADLAIGAPGEAVTSGGTTYPGAGEVIVVYGTVDGLAQAGRQRIDEGFGAGAVVNGSNFGRAVAAGDFNGDGYADLAVGAPLEDIGPLATIQTDAGTVSVLYGSASGLTPAGSQYFSSSAQVESGDAFGSSLAAGDFDGDGNVDLAVGVPAEDIGTHSSAGSVEVLSGSSGGLVPNDVWTENSNGVLGKVGTSDAFGFALAAGNVGKGPQDDLAIGVPGEHVGRAGDQAGAVEVLYGSGVGLTASNDQRWTQNSRGVPDSSEGQDGLGSSVAIGDLGKSPVADLVAGAPGDAITPAGGVGTVTIVYATSRGLRGRGAQTYSENSRGVPGTGEGFDALGTSVAIGNFGKGATGDLAVGVPGESGLSGAVIVLYSSKSGLHANGSQLWSQRSRGIKDSPEMYDRFGSASAAADLGHGRFADLAIGVPGESFGAKPSAGAVEVLYGARKGLRAANSQLWREGGNLGGSTGGYDGVGAALAAA